MRVVWEAVMLGGFSLKTLLAASAVALATVGADASTLKATVYSGEGKDKGNDCAGVFGKSFSECIDPVYKSPIIAKVEFSWKKVEDDSEDYENTIEPSSANWEFNSLFSSVLASMFTFTFSSDEGKTGTWTYTPCPTCPSITSFVAKGGNGFTHYWSDPQTALSSGSWKIENGLSHLSFYDTKPAVIPVPAAGFLLIGALGGLAALRRRRRAV